LDDEHKSVDAGKEDESWPVDGPCSHSI